MNVNKTHPTFIKILRVILVFGLILVGLGPVPVNSIALPSDGPQRTVTLQTNTTIYEWWLLSWKTSQVVCQMYVEHESWPDSSEVLYYCGSSIQSQWLKTKACVYSDVITMPQECNGLYLHLANVTETTKEVQVKLPAMEVFVSVSGCNQQSPQRYCTALPYLRLQAVEPLPNEQVIQILGNINGQPFSCPGAACDLPLTPTGMQGITVNFWAESSYGDASEVFTAQVRVIPWGNFADPDAPSPDKPMYYVDVLSSQWQGETLSACSSIWQAFQPVDGPPAWLSTPKLEENLVSKTGYYLLAGSLIQQGLVDAKACPNAGLEGNGAANACGMEAARPVVEDWQNQFDSEIIRVAEDTGIPAQMMKNIFGRESQFWPGIYNNVQEAGLGHLSDVGADAVLLWNPSFYSQFCPLILAEETCQRGFGNLDLSQQEMLRGALVQKVNASCPDCPVGIDLTQANFSISIFARSIMANCEQVGQILYNSTGQLAGYVAGYEDLWKFTLLNYNAGSGCLANALQRTINNRAALTWDNVKLNLEPVCQSGIAYVDDVSNMPASEASPLNVLEVAAAPPAGQATPVVTPQPTATPSPTLPAGTATPQPTTYP